MFSKLYKRRPEEILVMPWTGNNLKNIIDFIGWHKSASSKWTWEQYENHVKHHGLKIFTSLGEFNLPIGYYVLKDKDNKIDWISPERLSKEYYEIY